MKKRKNITAKVCLLLLLFAALAMIVLPFQAWAITGDIDDDGILDIDEDLPCLPWQNPSISQCLDADPEIPDLYVMFLNQDPTLVPPLPADPFELINAHFQVVPLVLHVINLTSPPLSQQIAENQNAVLLKINPSTVDGDLGASQVAYPAYGTGVSGSVFPNRILEDVQNACALQPECICWRADTDTPCIDANGNVVQGVGPIFDFFFKNVIAHETFHMVGRVVPPDRKLDNHYAQLGYIMDHHMYYKSYNSSHTVRWFITDTWADADKPRFK